MHSFRLRGFMDLASCLRRSSGLLQSEDFGGVGLAEGDLAVVAEMDRLTGPGGEGVFRVSNAPAGQPLFLRVAEAGSRLEAIRTHHAGKSAISRTSVRTPQPVGPFGYNPSQSESPSLTAVPAMSRWSHGVVGIDFGASLPTKKER